MRRPWDELSALLEAGKLSENDFALAAMKRADAFDRPESHEIKLAPAAEYNTTSSQEIVNKFQAQAAQPADRGAELLRAIRESNQLQEQQLREAKEMVRELRRAKVIKPRGN